MLSTHERFLCCLVSLAYLGCQAQGYDTPLVEAGSQWRYLDDGSNQGASWQASVYDDSLWSLGNAQLGYGDGDESTVVSFGPISTAKYITTYFRHTFNVVDPSLLGGLTLSLLRDDGAVVYLNGIEVMRSGLPAGSINWQTTAITSVAGSNESRFYKSFVDPTLLVAGENVIAVEVHQRSGTSSDLSFDLRLAQSVEWSYLDNGTDQGTLWKESAFDDSAWASGPGEIGYGDGDEATVVSFGPSSTNKYITTYFRHSFDIPGPGAVPGLSISLMRDDGAVVYINGVEAYRSNMPAGGINYLSLASSTVSSGAEYAFESFFVDPSMLVVGGNVLAVEVHQASATSSDISLDVRIGVSNGIASVVRGPYLQLGTSSSAIVRWRTDIPTNSQVSYGLVQGNLAQGVLDPILTTDHEVLIEGLNANTQYFYSVGSSSTTLAGDDADHHLTTLPTAGAVQPVRIWVLGDSGTANLNAAAVRDAYLNYSVGHPADMWLMLGDNAYGSGTDSEYQSAVFDMYPTVLRNTMLWSTLGNHDGYSADSATETGPYYDIFSLPRNAQAGGVASGTEAYYSFDYANIHFVCLESYETNRSVAGPMMTWLVNDLASTLQPWIIAFWHHPPYTKGSHNSDIEGRLIDMRQNALPILEAAGVDLVLSGHSHSYERSFLLNGHYGVSGTLAPSMLIDSGDGQDDGTGAYIKPTFGLAPHEGTVYVVPGSSGKIGGGPLNHPAMFTSLNVLGSMVIDVDDNRLDAVFLNSQGGISDHFTLIKGAQPCPADLNGDGGLNFFDISVFLQAFGANDPIADFTGDGLYNFFDISAFLQAFSAGCP